MVLLPLLLSLSPLSFSFPLAAAPLLSLSLSLLCALYTFSQVRCHGVVGLNLTCKLRKEPHVCALANSTCATLSLPLQQLATAVALAATASPLLQRHTIARIAAAIGVDHGHAAVPCLWFRPAVRSRPAQLHPAPVAHAASTCIHAGRCTRNLEVRTCIHIYISIHVS